MFKLENYFPFMQEADADATPGGSALDNTDAIEAFETDEPDEAGYDPDAPEPGAEPEGEPEAEEPSTDEDRPEWLPEKFKTVEDMAESHKQLEKKLGAFTGAPEDYEVDLGEDSEFSFYEGTEHGIDQFKDLAKDLNMNQDGFNKLVDFYKQSELERADNEADARMEASTQLLGDKAATIINTIDAKAKAGMDADTYALFQKAASAAPDSAGAAVLLVNKLMGGEPVQKSATYQQNNQTAPKSKTELRAMMSDKRYSQQDAEGEAYRAEVSREYKRTYG